MFDRPHTVEAKEYEGFLMERTLASTSKGKSLMIRNIIQSNGSLKSTFIVKKKIKVFESKSFTKAVDKYNSIPI